MNYSINNPQHQDQASSIANSSSESFTDPRTTSEGNVESRFARLAKRLDVKLGSCAIVTAGVMLSDIVGDYYRGSPVSASDVAVNILLGITGVAVILDANQSLD